MNLKNKIIAGALCALVAGIGIFGGGSAQAQTNAGGTATTIEQLQQMVNSLMQQIQQIIQQIAYWKPLETCGNGICRFGETPASCAADCKAVSCTSALTGAACEKAGGQEICSMLCSDPGGCKSGGCMCECVKTAVCGNNACETSETAATCPADCDTTCAKDGEVLISDMKTCCSGLVKISTPSATSIPSYTCKKPANPGVCAPGSVKGCQVCDSNGWWKDTDSKCATGKTCDQGQCFACAAAGETIYEFNRNCCAGLQKKEISACGSVDIACSSVRSWTCEKPGAPTQTSCSSNSECVTGGGTCHRCYNKTWWAAQSTSVKALEFCKGVGEAICECQSGACTVASICGDFVCEYAEGETAANCAADCGATATDCYGEGQGETGFYVSKKRCCPGLKLSSIHKEYPDGTTGWTEGFICIK